MSGTLRVALVGAGMVTEYHLRAWRRLSDATIAAIVDPDRPRRQARAEQFGIAKHYASLDDLLASEPVDALDIASPRKTHADLVRRAADHGLPVLCQKPLAPTHAEAEALARTVAGRVRLMVHENWRFRPYYRQMARWIESGAFGTLTSGTISFATSGLIPNAAGRRPALERQPFMKDEARFLVAETLIHHLDVSRWLLGSLSVVQARLVRATQDVAGESVATILLETEAGAPLVVSGTMVAHGRPALGRDRVELFGTQGSIAMQDDRLSLSGEREEEIRYEHDVAYQESFDAAIAHFAHCLRTGERFETEVEDNLMTLSLVERVYQLTSRAGAGPPREPAPS